MHLLTFQITKPKFHINLKSQFFNDQNFVWDFEFWSRAAQALAPRLAICLIFVFWDLKIFGAWKLFKS